MCVYEYAYTGLLPLSSRGELSLWMPNDGKFSLPNVFYTVSGDRHLTFVIWFAMSENVSPWFAFISQSSDFDNKY